MREGRWKAGLRMAGMVLLFALLGASPASQPAPAADTPRLQRYAICYTPGPHWLAGKAIWDQPLQAHGDYMSGLYARHTLIMGGPFTDSSGGLAIIEVADDQAAQSIVDHDPSITAGIFNASVHPWFCVDWQHYGR